MSGLFRTITRGMKGFPGEVSPVGRDVNHIPAFFREIPEILRPKEDQIFLDVTVGSGGHSNLILETQPRARVIASDRDPNAVQTAMRLTAWKHSAFTAFVSRFSELPEHLVSLGLSEGSIDGFIIDCGVSDIQEDDEGKGFALKGPLDLRMDAERFPDNPTASEVLQTINDMSLLRLLKNYGDLKKEARLVLNAILEARYMFHRFLTVEELRAIIMDAVMFSEARQSVCLTTDEANDWESRVTEALLKKTITALRMFVNDEVNELEYGIRIASHFLKTRGLLLVIVRNSAEEKALRKSLLEIDFDPLLSKDPFILRTLPWKLVGEMPLRISKADRLLHPRYEDARMYVASKEREMVTLAGRE